MIAKEKFFYQFSVRWHKTSRGQFLKIVRGEFCRRFEQGKLHINHTKFLGYDKDKNGNLVINPKQAKIVKRIYEDFLDGKGANRIARELENDGTLNWNGRAKWYEGSIRKMLTNEKYKGDALLPEDLYG